MGAKIEQHRDLYKQSGGSLDLYSDFLHSFMPHPNTGQISRKTNVEAVKLAIRNLLLTNKYERLRNPRFGSNLSRFLFEPQSKQTNLEIKQHIENTIEQYEPRVNILDIKVTSDEDTHSVEVSILFAIITSSDTERLDLTLYRVR